jgi:hypothetical protein
MTDEFQDPKQLKIFPRNLTARADYIVRGNPISSRPESGVDNCYPGLEFDQRNLDKAFFPGLVFEFHRPDGAILHEVVPNSLPAQAGLSQADLPLYLWAIIGQTTGDPLIFSFDGGLSGLDVWRRIHDLQPARTAVLMGPRGGLVNGIPAAAINATIEQYRGTVPPSVVRDPSSGNALFAAFADDRAGYLDEDGVIDMDVYQPGEFTRTLCVPWQLDFRDCGCFYWASNKPDLVASASAEGQHLNFLRRNRDGVPPPAVDIATAAGWGSLEMSYADLINGGWNDLPVVINDLESEQFIPETPVLPELMSREQVIEELRYLATVEHALSVEYLYAHYSLAAPMVLPNGADERTRRIYAAANQIFSIAVDEMRHLRWVNEALDLLGQPPSLGRAERIGRQLDRPFELAPLTPAQLQWFIDVEKPSQVIGGTIDGMYVRLHTSIDRQPNQFPERERLVHLIKLIIDEGEDHFERFTSVQNHLSGLAPDEYLRFLEDPAPGSAEQNLQQLCNLNYKVLLDSLSFTFAFGDRASGVLLEQSKRAMFNLHETSHFLAGKGIRNPFAPQEVEVAFVDVSAAHARVNELQESMGAVLTAVAQTGAERERALAERQLQVNNELFSAIHQLIEEALSP